MVKKFIEVLADRDLKVPVFIGAISGAAAGFIGGSFNPAAAVAVFAGIVAICWNL